MQLKDIDKKDREILHQLDLNSRENYSKIAKKLKINKESLKYRINKLKERKIIESFFTFSDLPKIGFNYYKVYIRLYESKKQEEKFIEYLRNNNKVIYISSCIGKYDFVINVLVKDHLEFKKFSEKLHQEFNNISLYDINTNTMQIKLNRNYLIEKQDIDIDSNPLFKKEKLNENHLKILSLLSNDSRITIEQLSKKVKLSRITTRKILNNLIKKQIIQKFTIKLNYDLINYKFVKIMFKLNNDVKKKKEFYEFASNHPNSLYLVESFGISDVDIDFEIKDISQLHEIIFEIKKRFSEIIKDYEVLFFVKEYKVDYLIF